MANPWRKALSSFLSIMLVAGLLPCASFYGSAWASDAESEGSAVEAAQASESAVAQPTDSTQLATAVQSSTETLPFRNTISAAGENHSAAITPNGELWIWGRNSEFQLGYSSGDEKNYDPKKLMDNVASVALGTNFSAAVKNNGELWTWGWNYKGVVGNEDTGGTHGFAPAKLMDDVVSVSLGYLHAAAIKRDGSLWTWGDNSHGELGNGTTNDSANHEPKKIMDDVAAVSLGTGYSAAIKRDGSLMMWGDNSYGQFGNGTTEGSTVPVKVMDGVSSVSLGECHTGVIMPDGSLLTWGRNLDGQLGNGTTEDSSVPAKVMDDVASISFGGPNSSAVKKDGTLWVWGNGSYNQVGASYWDQSKPVQYLEGVVYASVGYNHTAAVKQDGTLWTWGCNNYGQLGYVTVEQQWTPYQVQAMEKVALPAGSSGTVPSETIPSDLFTASAWFKASGGDGEAATVVNWDDAWFNTSSYTYNHDLATTAAVLAAAAYDESFVKKTLREQLGFNAFDSVEYHPEGKDYNGDYDQVGFSIETRMTSNGVPIIAVIVRGTPGNGEWLSNLNVADTLQNSDQETHEGFKAGALQVLRALRSYVYDNGIDLDKARVLITGHSRGAAVSNILGARLDDGLTTDAGTLSPDNVYTFTFESPNATRASNRSDAKYGNIFNIVNPEDVVIKVPLGEWGYGRYGNDLALPSRSNTRRGDYKAQLAKMNEYFERFSDGEKY